MDREVFTKGVPRLWISLKELKQAVLPVIRGTVLGSILGILPGGGAPLAAFASYAFEKRIAKDPSRFGNGAIEGVAGPEAANNAGAQLAFAPLLTLGIPSNGVMALMLGALMIHNIQPGPDVIVNNPDLFWGVIASMWVGNALLVVLNLPMIRIWIKLLTVPYEMLYPTIVLFICIGVYSLSNSTFDVFLIAGFGVLGYVFLKLKCEPAPFLLGFILGPLMEENLRRALRFSGGDPSTFVSSPISVTLLGIGALLLILLVIPMVRSGRKTAFAEGEN
jgi:TctA family transporter